jgi:hypothetical protein
MILKIFSRNAKRGKSLIILLLLIAYFNRFKGATLNQSQRKSRLMHKVEEDSKSQIVINDSLPFQSSLF